MNPSGLSQPLSSTESSSSAEEDNKLLNPRQYHDEKIASLIAEKATTAILPPPSTLLPVTVPSLASTPEKYREKGQGKKLLSQPENEAHATTRQKLKAVDTFMTQATTSSSNDDAPTINSHIFDKAKFESWIEYHYLDRNFISWDVILKIYMRFRQHKSYFKIFFNDQEYAKGWESYYDESFFDLMHHLNLQVTTIDAGGEIIYQIHQVISSQPSGLSFNDPPSST